jgi:hypothetical protein
MKIAFMHYHLKTGGVTTVLRKQLDAVARQCETLVFTGLLPEVPFPADIVHIPELGYSSEYKGSFDPQNVAQAILKAIHSRFNGPCDVLHVHNPTLAKNRLFLRILKSLQNKDVRLFLQIHDFAEDGRPLAYFAEEYPANCHYGVINSRDYKILIKAGLNKNGLHRLENPVDPYDGQQLDQTSTVLYPIRAIRRKNIGEAVLLSLFFKHGQTLAVTLPPNSPADMQSYESWKAFVKDQKLNVVFDRGQSHDFKTMVLSAASLVTTSITEGFGFSFLEPWVFGKLLWGRKLPEICRDFEMNGIQLKHLYAGLFVPLEWIDFRRFKKKWTTCVLNASALFNFNIDQARIRNAFDAITKDGTVDFGLLDESSQKKVILQLVSSINNREELIRRNAFLLDPGTITDQNALISENQAVIRQHYNPTLYRQRLGEIYHRVGSTAVEHRIDKTVLISEFFNLEKFSLLKWSAYGE